MVIRCSYVYYAIWKTPFETADVKLTYKRIKMNSYKFPENIKVDESAKKLIESILVLDPAKRPTLDEIAQHDFFKIYQSVPFVLPLSTLSCPPGPKYIEQFLKIKTIVRINILMEME